MGMCGVTPERRESSGDYLNFKLLHNLFFCHDQTRDLFWFCSDGAAEVLFMLYSQELQI